MTKITPIISGAKSGPFDLADFSYNHKAQSAGTAVSCRCPHCGHKGVFSSGEGTCADFAFELSRVEGVSGIIGLNFGARICPNRDCRGAVFIVAQGSEVLATFPPRTLEFDAANLPTGVRDSLSEAIRCHAAECFKASAIMVRRTLEEVCEDKSVTGTNLKKRLEDLKDKVTLPQALFEAMDSLRLLGNDAAHIEANAYNEIGEKEVVIAIRFVQEVVKAVYQYEDLLAQIRSLQKQ